MPLKTVTILDCSVLECVYNKQKKCHTPAITVGDGMAHEEGCPMCDTFMSGQSKGGAEDVVGNVGACHMADCQFNQSLECSAPGIQVAKHQEHADCDTYQPKK